MSFQRKDTICEECGFRFKRRKKKKKHSYPYHNKWPDRCPNPKCRAYDSCRNLSTDEIYKRDLLDLLQGIMGGKSKNIEEIRSILRSYAEDGAKRLDISPGPLSSLSPSHPRPQKERRAAHPEPQEPAKKPAGIVKKVTVFDQVEELQDDELVTEDQEEDREEEINDQYPGYPCYPNFNINSQVCMACKLLDICSKRYLELKNKKPNGYPYGIR